MPAVLATPAPRHAVVLNGGSASAPPFPLPSNALVVAADSGYLSATLLGLTVDVLVGDFDSLPPEALQEAQDRGVAIERHPVAKDATDLEIAIAAAVARGAEDVLIVGGGGGRFDHLVANVLTLVSEEWRRVRLRAWMDGSLVTVVRDEVALVGVAGQTLTLLPAAGPATGIVTTGLRYPLDDETLTRYDLVRPVEGNPFTWETPVQGRSASP